jgi:hypothetical protein
MCIHTSSRYFHGTVTLTYMSINMQVARRRHGRRLLVTVGLSGIHAAAKKSGGSDAARGMLNSI